MNFQRSLAFLLSMAVLADGVPARADGPDYDGTVAYIKSRVNGTLVEQRPCVFRAAGITADKAHVFHAGTLEVVPSAITPSEVHFDCTKAEKCISYDNAPKTSVVNFSVHSDTEGVAIAISRLVEMCGTVTR